ncbi:MAG: (2Fe-2S) ferredoxin domain-containing protein [Methylococcales bacterium]|nr:(2Fe-2S) ferredoxin domain-containing protein [Methylococcales bacterium]
MTEQLKPKMMDYHRHILVCIGDRCTPNGEGQAIYDQLKNKFEAAGIHQGALRVKKTRATCFGTCKFGPLLCVQPDGVWYYNVTIDKLDRIINEHLLNNKPVLEWVYYQNQIK